MFEQEANDAPARHDQYASTLDSGAPNERNWPKESDERRIRRGSRSATADPEFDQICMKSGDMVMLTEFVARWASGKLSCFIGDGDATSVRVACLQA